MNTNDLTNDYLKKYVVYTHINKLTNEPFYVGCGSEKRPYLKSCRNDKWNELFAQLGWQNIEIQINQEFYSDVEAFEYEQFLIAEYGRSDMNTGTLVNQTNGGVGANGLINYNRTRQRCSPVFCYENGTITTTDRLNQVDKKANNYYYRLATMQRGDGSQYKFVDLMTNQELENLANHWNNYELLNYIK